MRHRTHVLRKHGKGDIYSLDLFTHTHTGAGKATPHYDDVIMTMLASQITSLTVVYSIVYSGVDQSKHQSSASLAFVQEIHRGPVNFPHKWPVTRKMFPFDDVIMEICFKLTTEHSNVRRMYIFPVMHWKYWKSLQWKWYQKSHIFSELCYAILPPYWCTVD